MNITNQTNPPAHYQEQGSGNVVVLMHGWGSNSELFAPITQALQNTYRVIVPDFPGFGQTAAPPEAWGVQDYTRWLLDLLKELQVQQAYFVGHSFGGRIGIILASQHPNLVKKLVLTDSAGIRPKRTFKYHIKVRSYKLMRWFSQQSWLGPLQTWGQKKVAQRGSADYQQAAGTVRSSLVRVVNEDLRHLLPQIQAETLLVWGDQDQDTPLEDAKLMERLIPDAGLVVFDGAGHYAYLERAPVFNTVVETFFSAPAATDSKKRG